MARIFLGFGLFGLICIWLGISLIGKHHHSVYKSTLGRLMIGSFSGQYQAFDHLGMYSMSSLGSQFG